MDYLGPDRREKLRYKLRSPAEYSIRFSLSGKDHFLASISGNIGLGGILLLSPEPFSQGELLDIEISYHIGEKNVQFLMTGEIVWVEEKGNDDEEGKKYSIGAQFTELDSEQNSELIDFLEKYIAVEDSDEVQM